MIKSRLIFSLLSLLIILGCSLDEPKVIVAQDKLKEELKSVINDSTLNSQNVGKEKEYLSEKLSPIRQQLSDLAVYGKTGWTAINKRKLYLGPKNSSNGAIVYSYLHGELKKLSILEIDSSQTIKYHTVIYLKDSVPFFAFKTEFDSSKYKIDPKWYEPFEDSLFFENGSVIRIKSSGDFGSPFASEYLEEEELDIRNKVEQAFSRL